jgi:hypothetical protein
MYVQHLWEVDRLRRRAAALSLLSETATTAALRDRLTREAAELLCDADRVARRLQRLPKEKRRSPTHPFTCSVVERVAPSQSQQITPSAAVNNIADAQRRMQRTDRAVTNLLRRLGIEAAPAR